MSVVLSGVDRGDTRIATATFTNLAGVPTNPSTVTFKVMDPSGVASQRNYVSGTDAEVTNPSVGVFKLTLSYTISGVWLLRVEGTGAVAEVISGLVDVREDAFV